MLRIESAAEFAAGEAVNQSSSAGESSGPTADSAKPSDGTSAATEQPAGNSSSGTGSGETGGSGNGASASLLANVGQMLGDRLGLPKNGTLRLEMKDGSTQEINLADVKKISVKQ